MSIETGAVFICCVRRAETRHRAYRSFCLPSNSDVIVWRRRRAATLFITAAGNSGGGASGGRGTSARAPHAGARRRGSPRVTQHTLLPALCTPLCTHCLTSLRSHLPRTAPLSLVAATCAGSGRASGRHSGDSYGGRWRAATSFRFVTAGRKTQSFVGRWAVCRTDRRMGR